MFFLFLLLFLALVAFVAFVVLVVPFVFAALVVCAAGAVLHVVVAALVIKQNKKGVSRQQKTAKANKAMHKKR